MLFTLVLLLDVLGSLWIVFIGIQDFGSDPVLAVSKAMEGIENRINHMNDRFNDAQGMLSQHKNSLF